jgi:hypothetical protein
MRGIAVAILLLFVALPSIGRAREQSTSTYTKDQVDARISELRSLYNSQFVPRSEFDTKLNAFQSDMKQLIDRNERLDEQRALSVKQSVDTLQSEIKQNEQIDQQRGHAIVENMKDLERTKAPAYYSLVGPMLGGFISAAIGGLVVWLIARRVTLRLKMIESTLEFSKRFGELIQEQSDLNQIYMEKRAAQNIPPSNLETDQALPTRC